jgi:hypothetical protein
MPDIVNVELLNEPFNFVIKVHFIIVVSKQSVKTDFKLMLNFVFIEVFTVAIIIKEKVPHEKGVKKQQVILQFAKCHPYNLT